MRASTIHSRFLMATVVGACLMATACGEHSPSTPVRPLTAENRPTGLRPYLVMFRRDTAIAESAIQALVTSVHGRLNHVYTLAINGFSADLPDEGAQAIARLPYVVAVTIDTLQSVLDAKQSPGRN